MMPSRNIMKHILTWGFSLVIVCAGLSPATAAGPGDSDGDGIPDAWEINGYDADGDGIVDVDLPAMGASPYHKDLFVEMDYMPGLLPSAYELGVIVDSFAQLPIVNPDGNRGINLHLDAGPARGQAYDLGGGNEIPHSDLLGGINSVMQLRRTDSDPARRGIFHYMVWGDSYQNSSSSGLAWSRGMEFMVTVGPRFWGKASPGARVGSFIHELGHNLGLGHGGRDGVNDKPNYFSVMNYRYQVTGVPRLHNSNYFGYSTRTLPALDENALDETRGFGAGAAGYAVEDPRDRSRLIPANGPLDLNHDGKIATTPVSADLNGDGSLSTLTAISDAQSLFFPAGTGRRGVGPDGNAPTVEENELTAEDARAQGAID